MSTWLYVYLILVGMGVIYYLISKGLLGKRDS